MTQFFKNILNSKNATSSRRFVAMVGLILFTATVICGLCGVDIGGEILYATGGLTTICLGLTTIK